MKFRDRILRTVVALSIATMVSAQIPTSGGAAFAQDDYDDNEQFLGISGLSGQEFLQGAFIAAGAVVIVDAVTGGSFAGIFGGRRGGEEPMMVGENAPIYDVAGGQGFTTLQKAADSAGLKPTLKDDAGPYTVFAPNNEAFAKLPVGTLDSLMMRDSSDKLRDLLQYHTIPGRFTADDLSKLEDGTTLQTLAGSTVTITKTGGIKVNGVPVIKADIPASNGIVHEIGSVLMPGKTGS